MDIAGVVPRLTAGPPKQDVGDVLEHTLRNLPSVAASRRLFPRETNGPRVIAVSHPAGKHEAVDPVAIVQAVAPNPSVSFARLDHEPGAFVDPDVRHERSSRVVRKEH